MLKNWNGWTTQSNQGGIEINGIPELAANTIRFGNFFAELDLHCWHFGLQDQFEHVAGVPDLATGDYELELLVYLLRAQPRLRQPDAVRLQDRRAGGMYVGAARIGGTYTNRIEVFFQKKSSSYATPSKDVTRLLIRSMSAFTPTSGPSGDSAEGHDWRNLPHLLQAAGREDTYGGLIDYIRFCSGSCP